MEVTDTADITADSAPTAVEHSEDAGVNVTRQETPIVADVGERPTKAKEEHTKSPSTVPRPEAAGNSEPTLREEFHKIASAIRSNPLYSDVSDLVHWHDPIRTGLLFGIFNFAFYLITSGGYSVVTLATYCALTLLSAAFIYSNGMIMWARYIQGVAIENPLCARWSASKWHVSRAVVEKHIDSVVNLLNAILDISRDVFYCAHFYLSLKFAGIFFVVSLFGKWFSGSTLLYIVGLLMFAWPRVYHEKKKEIDHHLNLASVHATNTINLALSKIPKLDKRKTQ